MRDGTPPPKSDGGPHAPGSRVPRGLGARLDLTPPTDERPFFFNQLPLCDPLKTIRLTFVTGEAGVVSGNLLETTTLPIPFLVSAFLVIVTLILPLRPAIRDVGRTLAFGGTACFMLIGIGFMAIEIGLPQRMSVFLGHPVYSLSVVPFSIILSTGIVSLICHRLPLDTPKKLIGWSMATSADPLPRGLARGKPRAGAGSMRERMKRWAALGLGWFFIVLGIAGLFLPFLQGILFLLVGLVLLSRESRLVKRFLAYIRLRYPRHYGRARAAEKSVRAWWRRVWRRCGWKR